jgi:hypothetical protein
MEKWASDTGRKKRELLYLKPRIVKKTTVGNKTGKPGRWIAVFRWQEAQAFLTVREDEIVYN